MTKNLYRKKNRTPFWLPIQKLLIKMNKTTTMPKTHVANKFLIRSVHHKWRQYSSTIFCFFFFAEQNICILCIVYIRVRAHTHRHTHTMSMLNKGLGSLANQLLSLHFRLILFYSPCNSFNNQRGNDMHYIQYEIRYVISL